MSNSNGKQKKSTESKPRRTDDLTDIALPTSAYADQDLLAVGPTLSGKTILVTGTTGFLAKVFVSMLLRYHPDIEQLYLVIRSQRDRTAEERFFDEIAESPTFDPLREIYGIAGLKEFLHEKVTVVAGDIAHEHLGLPKKEATEISGKLDLFVNSAGLTNFNPNLENALNINTLSANHILEFIRLGGSRARLLHVSTSFVAGSVSGPTPEILPSAHVYPRHDEIQSPLDLDREISDCQAMIEHAKGLSYDQERQTLFTQKAREWMEKNNRNPEDKDTFDKLVTDERAKWIKSHLSQEGRERAEHWGWVNIYTYTKSMGERILVEHADEIEYSLFRPAIIESAERYPMPGWNEGINTTAPICYLVYKGHRFIPCKTDVRLDVIPVDLVTGAMIAIGAALIAKRHHKVYHIGSSDLNPLSMKRVVELTTLGSRQLTDADLSPTWQKLVMKSLEAVPVDQKTFNRQSLPGFARAAGKVGGMLDKVDSRQLGSFGKVLRSVRKQARTVEKLALTGEKIFELFAPFIHDNNYCFEAKNIVELRKSLQMADRDLYGCNIELLDWRTYWLDLHTPGLAKWSFPNLEAKLRTDSRSSYAFHDLVELFDASTANYPDNIAFQHHNHGIVERYTYGELKAYAERGAIMLKGFGLAPQRAVLLASENRPQWGMAYFAVLKAGAITVPVDHESTADQLANLAASCGAALIVVSKMVDARLGEELRTILSDRQLPTQVVILQSLFTLALPAPEDVQPTIEADEIDSNVASLIYTSGTTGDPKGVMLSHKNFASLLSSLDGTFKLTDRDGFLSVLPLHHTFEFSAGFLMPLSKGAAITFLEDLSGDELKSAMNSTRITALIGVPALWQLLHRSINQKLDASSPAAKVVFDNLVALNKSMRNRAGINMGPLFFGAVHRAFGNHIKYLISGGASLPADTLEAFHGLGFDLYEGYGLTEAAPVLTVNSPKQGLKPGSVGHALPEVDIKILDPDEHGVGEILARGPNIMLGYLGRPEETAEALQDGWLHTGDLGVLDHKGLLTIVGRQKEVIVTAGGKNAYPDELEDLYGTCPHVLELAVVGFPDGHGSERVAALIRPDVPVEAANDDIAQIRQEIREWIRVEGQRVSAHSRIQVLRFWDEELPRTATRKVKRRDVVEILERLVSAEEVVSEQARGEHASTWLEQSVANLAGVKLDKVHSGSHFIDDLGFDSLMFVELASVLEAKGTHVSPEVISNCETLGDVQTLMDSGTGMVKSNVSYRSDRVEVLPIHPTVAKLGQAALHRAQMKTYSDFFDVDVYGKANIPYHNPNVIVVANHSSHLDMGLVKYALGDFGRNIRALAAADYFFSNTARKTYFKNFTNLIPVERAGTPDLALRGALEALENGDTILMFPEGTRSTDGKLRPFRRGLGYLVAAQRVNILPVYVDGTYRALPKGAALPSLTSRKMKVRVGDPIDAFSLLQEAGDLTGSSLYDFIAQRAHDSVKALRDAYLPKVGDVDLLKPIFAELNTKFEQNQVSENVAYYFSLGSVDEQKWTVLVNADDCEIHQGKPREGQADCVVKTSPEIFRKIVQERYIPSMDEFMDGTIKTNSPDLLMRFQVVFKLQG